MPNTHHKKENGVPVGGSGCVQLQLVWSPQIALGGWISHHNPFALVLVQQNFLLPANLDWHYIARTVKGSIGETGLEKAPHPAARPFAWALQSPTARRRRRHRLQRWRPHRAYRIWRWRAKRRRAAPPRSVPIGAGRRRYRRSAGGGWQRGGGAEGGKRPPRRRGRSWFRV